MKFKLGGSGIGSRAFSTRAVVKILLAVIAISPLAWWGYSKWKAGQNPGEDYIVAEVQRGDIEDKVTATGVLQPRDFVDVGAQVSGQLSRIHVEVGSEVKVGDLLAEIDAEVSAARVEASQAQLRAQRATLAEREVNFVKAQRDFQRQKNLMTEDATTEEAMQNADTAQRAAALQIEALKAQIDQLQAGIRVEQTNLKFSRIVSPMAGTVVSITAKRGQTLNANQSAPNLMRVADLSVMTVQAQVSEADVGRLRSGMKVYFTTLGGKNRRWYGELRKIDPTPTVTNNVVLYNALFDVPNSNGQLMTQMTAQVMFIVNEVSDVLFVPVSALTFEQGDRKKSNKAETSNQPRKATVKVMKAKGETEVREVTVGMSTRIQAEVLSGLVEGEKVVAGVRAADKPAANSAANSRDGQARNSGGMPGGMGMQPGGLGGGVGGGRR
ncbi:macrolide-specific efflux system membrane fusion protein [Limnobacter thiooxidans]|uniref:Macrolide transporter subunit MacA n=1 Tax=Limnobacter thiooxidans TaxID=131080 RepID=A0AA86J910_9BURK|nr:macrolide-specific efflux system membrane fusion protein [Limnobacter thiooxidans]BET26850.1 macrolide transporter subunit MacA [Limnobacter thiooxidans]